MSPTALVLLSIVLVSCAASGPSHEMPPFEGASTLDQTLKKDGYATASEIAQSNGCSDIDRVITTTIPSEAYSMSLLVTERWVLHGCGRMYPFVVNVCGDGEGGTIVDVRSDF